MEQFFFLCIASVLSRVTCIQTNLDEEPETVREEFHNFLAKVISNWTDKRDQEELSIMNTWGCLLSEEPRVFHLVYRIEIFISFFWWLVIIYFPLSKVIWQLKTTLVLSLVENFMNWQMLRIVDRLSRNSPSKSFFLLCFYCSQFSSKVSKMSLFINWVFWTNHRANKSKNQCNSWLLLTLKWKLLQ